MTTWLTAADDAILAELWADAPENPDVCNLYLNAAKSACLAYAPAQPAAVLAVVDGYLQSIAPPIPDEWRIAQAMQARNTYNAGLAAPGGEFDGGGYGLSAFPLDWQVKQLLRPQLGVGAIV